jgi:hypothetical protein
VDSFAIVIVRAAGLFSFLGGCLWLVASVAGSWGKVGLVYWQTFLLTVVLPPVLLAVAGALLLWLGAPLGRFLARGLGGGTTAPPPGKEEERRPRFRTAERSRRE